MMILASMFNLLSYFHFLLAIQDFTWLAIKYHFSFSASYAAI